MSEYEYIYKIVKDMDGVDCYIKTGEIVRCKDCKYSVDYYNDGECYCRRPGREMQWISKKWDFFCGAGRRKDE